MKHLIKFPVQLPVVIAMAIFAGLVGMLAIVIMFLFAVLRKEEDISIPLNRNEWPWSKNFYRG